MVTTEVEVFKKPRLNTRDSDPIVKHLALLVKKWENRNDPITTNLINEMITDIDWFADSGQLLRRYRLKDYALNIVRGDGLYPPARTCQELFRQLAGFSDGHHKAVAFGDEYPTYKNWQMLDYPGEVTGKVPLHVSDLSQAK